MFVTYSNSILKYICMHVLCNTITTSTVHVLKLHDSIPLQKVTDFNEICDEIERETERVTGNNKVCYLMLASCLSHLWGVLGGVPGAMSCTLLAVYCSLASLHCVCSFPCLPPT